MSLMEIRKPPGRLSCHSRILSVTASQLLAQGSRVIYTQGESETRDDSCVTSPQIHQPLISLSCLSFRRARKTLNTLQQCQGEGKTWQTAKSFFFFFYFLTHAWCCLATRIILVKCRFEFSIKKQTVVAFVSVNPKEEKLIHLMVRSCCCCWCSVAQSCPILCDVTDCSMPGFPVLHHLAQTYVHWVVMSSNHLILCCLLLLLPSVFMSIRLEVGTSQTDSLPWVMNR